MDDERIYLPLQGGGVVALERETGDVAWTAPIESPWPPVTAPGMVVLATVDAIRACDATSGEERWVTPVAGLSAPLATDLNRVVAATADGEALALRVDTGAVLWRRSLGSVSRHPAATASTRGLAFTLENGQVVMLNRDTGQTLWTRSLAGTLSAPAVARDRILVGSTSNFFHALDVETGADTWTWRAGGDVIGAVAEGDVVYFASLDNVLRAVNRRSGNQQWKTVIPTRPAAPPIALDGIVVVSGVAPRVDAFLGRTGASQGDYTALADLEGIPLIDPVLKPYRVGMVAITRDGRVTALRPTKMMMLDPPLVPVAQLPGRRIQRELLTRGS